MKTRKALILFCLLAVSGILLSQTELGKSDLRLKNIHLNKTSIQQGGNVGILVSMIKHGDATGPFMIDLYLSKSTHLKSLTADKRISRITVAALARGRKSVKKSKTCKIPVTLKSGSYFIVALIDSTNQVKEINESNNTGSTALTVDSYTPAFSTSIEIPKPDVELNSFTVGNRQPDGTVQVTIYFKNKGKVNVKNLGYKVQVSRERSITSRKSTYPGVIPPGDTSITIVTTVTISDDYVRYGLRFCVHLDPDNVLKESDEGNNHKCGDYLFTE